jgi:transposase
MAAHVLPVHRCAELIEALTGAKPSPGFVHGLLARAAAAVKHANQPIRALIITASVISADETPIRVGPGPKTRKKYLLVACTNLLTYYFLGDRSLASFEAFVFPDLTGVVVHDRYQNYDKFPGITHQLCAAHLLRDLEDAAQSYPAAIWPGQIADALRALIHAANLARDQGFAAVPADAKAEHLRLFRHGVRVGLSQVRRIPGANVEQPPARLLLECLRDREGDVLRFLSDLRIPRRRTRPSGTCARRRSSRRSPAGSAPSRPPGTGTPSAATFPPPPSTASACSPPCATRSRGIPVCRPSPPPAEIRLPATTPRDESERSA